MNSKVPMILLALVCAIAVVGMCRTASAQTCTDGVDCLCDTARMKQGDILLCEDFDNPAFDDGTGIGWTSVYPGGNDDCDDFGAQPRAGEGPDAAWKCYNIVTNASCDVSGLSDCALENQALGEKFDSTWTHGIFGGKTIGPSGNHTTLGVTYIYRWSPNFAWNDSIGVKTMEWQTPQGRHTLTGQNAWRFSQASECTFSGTGSLDQYVDDYVWTRTLRLTSQVDVSSATCTKGLVWINTEPRMNFSPLLSDFPGGVFPDTTQGWSCIRIKLSGLGQTGGTFETWWQHETDPTETKIIDVSGLNMTTTFTPINRLDWDNYFNGNPNGDGYAGTTRAYRYTENFVITDGDPVTCAEVGFGTAPSQWPLRISGRRLQDQQGNDFVIKADAGWELISNTNSLADVRTYLDDRQAKGVNAILIRGVTKFGIQTNPENTASGDDNPWGTNAPDPFVTYADPTAAGYWSYVDSVMQELSDRGMVALLAFAYPGFNCSSAQGHASDINSLTAQEATDYGTWLANRYASYGNVIWVVGGDVNPSAAGGCSGFPNLVSRMGSMRSAIEAEWLADTGENAILTGHAGRQVRGYVSDWAPPNSNVDSLYSDGSSQTSNTRHAEQAIDAWNGHTDPFFDIESRYYRNATATSDVAQRLQTWQPLTMGAIGGVPGSEAVWCFEGVDNPASACDGFSTVGQPWTTHLDYAGVDTMELVQLVESTIDLSVLLPDTTDTVCNAGRNTTDDWNYVGCSYDATEGFIAYLPVDAPLTVNVAAGGWSAMTFTLYDATDPTGATTTTLADQTGSVVIDSPYTSDTVIVGVPVAAPATCGDGVITPPEVCDTLGPVFDPSDTCETVFGYQPGGTLACDPGCGSISAGTCQPYANEVGRCTDGFDNDNDGDTDCADSDCSADPACNMSVVWTQDFEGANCVADCTTIGASVANGHTCNYTSAPLLDTCSARVTTGSSGFANWNVGATQGASDHWYGCKLWHPENDASTGFQAPVVGLYEENTQGYGIGYGSGSLRLLNANEGELGGGTTTYSVGSTYWLCVGYDRASATVTGYKDGVLFATATAQPDIVPSLLRTGMVSSSGGIAVMDELTVCDVEICQDPRTPPPTLVPSVIIEGSVEIEGSVGIDYDGGAQMASRSMSMGERLLVLGTGASLLGAGAVAARRFPPGGNA